MNTQEIKDSRTWKNVFKIIIPYFFVVGGSQALASIILGISLRESITDMSTRQVVFFELFSTIGTISVVWLFRNKIDKKSFPSMGFNNLNIGTDILWGVIIGFVIMAISFTALLITSQVRFIKFDFNLRNLIESVLIYILVAVSEEIFMRGYVLNNLLASYNKNIALIQSAVFFSAMHIVNENVSFLGLLGVFMAGILLGIGYIYSNGLWFPIALHFSWNFFQGTIFGFNVSGIHQYSLIVSENKSQNIWNGGKFGFEGSILSFFFISLALFAIIWLFRGRQSTFISNN